MRIYRRTDDPVYYSIPFDKEIRTKTLFILREIEKKWKANRTFKPEMTAVKRKKEIERWDRAMKAVALLAKR